MELDLHYYGTYYAAIRAGYTETEAETIAYTAQYVDDSTIELINNVFETDVTIRNYLTTDWNQNCGIDYIPIATSQTTTEILQSNLTLGTSNENLLRLIWSVFHFLPGNYETPQSEQYQGAASSGLFGRWTYDTRSKWELNLLCLPNSSLVSDMINELKESTDLYLIGVRMHVLADTWSHKYYIGSPSWCFNDVGAQVYNLSNGKQELVKWGLSGEACTPSAFSFYSAAYLGHGRMGHLPDLPWISYRYQPQWKNQPIDINNPEDFRQGISQMYTALKYIREGTDTDFDPKTITPIPDEKNIIADLLNYKQELGIDTVDRLAERCQNWIYALLGMGIKPPIKYNTKKWNQKSPEFKLFHQAAGQHRDFVTTTLKNNGLDLSNAPA